MSTTLIPVLIQRASATALFAMAVFMVAAHTLLASSAARRAALGPRMREVAPWLVAGFLAIWLAVALVVADAANFSTPVPHDARLGARFGVPLLVGFGPMLAAIGLLFATKTMAALNEATPSPWLIRIQAYRMAGLVFLYPFLYYGVIPAAFALPAAVGDFLTGLLAPVVASALQRQRSSAFMWAVAWNLFGILDLIVAPTAAVLSQAPVISLYPLALVPLFIGPPLGILTHVLSLRNLATARRHDTSEDPTTIARGVGAL
jgi:hypothetical protein